MLIFLFNIYVVDSYLAARQIFDDELRQQVKLASQRKRIALISYYTPFDILLPNADSHGKSLFNILILAIIYITLPMSIVLLMLIVYLPSHDLVDIFAMRWCVLVAAVVGPIFLLRNLHRFVVNAVLKGVVVGAFLTHSLLSCVFVFFVALIPNESVEKILVNNLPGSLLRSVVYPAVVADRLNIGLDTFSGVAINTRREMPVLTFLVFEASRTPFNLRRNLVLRGVDLVPERPSQSEIKEVGAQEAWRETGRKLDLRGRNLEFADFSKSDISGAILSGALLRGVELSDAKLRFVSAEPLTGTTAAGCAGRRTEAVCRTVFNLSNLQGADLTGANMLGLVANATNFAGLTDATIRDSSFAQAELYLAGLAGIDGSGVNFSGAYLAGADLRDADLRFANLSWADLSAAFLYNADLTGANLANAKLKLTSLRESSLYGADLSGTKFVATNVFMANFGAATLKLPGPVPADFQKFAEFQHVDFSRILVAELDEYQIEGLRERFAQPDAFKNIDEVLRSELSRFYPNKDQFVDSLVPIGSLYDGRLDFDSWGLRHPDVSVFQQGLAEIAIQETCEREDAFVAVGMLRQIGFSERRDRLKYERCILAPDIIGPCQRQLPLNELIVLESLLKSEQCSAVHQRLVDWGLIQRVTQIEATYRK